MTDCALNITLASRNEPQIVFGQPPHLGIPFSYQPKIGLRRIVAAQLEIADGLFVEDGRAIRSVAPYRLGILQCQFIVAVGIGLTGCIPVGGRSKIRGPASDKESNASQAQSVALILHSQVDWFHVM